SDLGAQYKKQAEEQVKVKVLGPTFFGTRQVGLRAKKRINTPADMAGIKLRMPPGDAWQLLGRSLGANPTPMAFAETYTGLQTGAIDGQDNPLPNVQAMKFYEVMSQIVVTSHLIGYDLLCMTLTSWYGVGGGQQQSLQAAAMGLWIVLGRAAFVVKESEEVRFDLLTGIVGRRGRIVMAMVAAAALLVLYVASVPATYKYVTFMKVEKASYLKIRMDWLFSIYVLFLVAIIVRYVWILYQLLRGRDPGAPDATNATGG